MSTTITHDKFDYQKSLEKPKQTEIRFSKRKRLFDDEDSTTPDEEQPEAIIKKVKPTPDTDYAREILKLYQSKEYKKCLDVIDEFFKSSNEAVRNVSQFRIIRAACWIMMDTNKEEVASSLDEIIKSHPENSFAFYALGLAQYRSGEFLQSISSFEKAVDLNPSLSMRVAMECQAKAACLVELLSEADQKFDKDQFLRTLEILNAASLIDPENERINDIVKRRRYKFLGKITAKMEREVDEQFEQKIAAIEEQINSNNLTTSEKLLSEIQDEKFSSCLYLRGLLLYMRGGLQDSQLLFSEALLVDPLLRKAEAMMEKAKSFEEKLEEASEAMNGKEFSKAVTILTEALYIDPNNQAVIQIVHFQRSLAYFNQNDTENALKDYEQFESLKKKLANV